MRQTIEAAPLAEAVSDRKQRDKLRRLYAEYRDLAAEIKVLDDRKEAMKQEIEELMLIYDLQKVEVEDGAGLQLIPGSRSSIDRDTLIREGIDLALIAKATKRSEYNMVKVWKAKEEE